MMKDLIGQQVGNYRLVKLLGVEASLRSTWANMCDSATQAAIKVLHAHLSDEEISGF